MDVLVTMKDQKVITMHNNLTIYREEEVQSVGTTGPHMRQGNTSPGPGRECRLKWNCGNVNIISFNKLVL